MMLIINQRYREEKAIEKAMEVLPVEIKENTKSIEVKSTNGESKESVYLWLNSRKVLSKKVARSSRGYECPLNYNTFTLAKVRCSFLNDDMEFSYEDVELNDFKEAVELEHLYNGNECVTD